MLEALLDKYADEGIDNIEETTVLKVDLSEVPTYVAQAGYLRVIPTGGIVRVDAEVKAGSEGILEVREAGVSGSLTNISLAGLAAGKGTVILHHFNVAGVETGSQEVDINIQAPLLRFGMDQYDLSPDGKVKKGMLFYSHPDGTAFYDSDWKRFDPPLAPLIMYCTMVHDEKARQRMNRTLTAFTAAGFLSGKSSKNQKAMAGTIASETNPRYTWLWPAKLRRNMLISPTRNTAYTVTLLNTKSFLPEITSMSSRM